MNGGAIRVPIPAFMIPELRRGVETGFLIALSIKILFFILTGSHVRSHAYRDFRDCRLRHPALDVGPFLCEIALGFENGPPDQSVETPAHFWNPALEIESRQFSAKFIDQQLPKTGLDLVMAWLAREMAEKIYRGRSNHRSKIAAGSSRDNPGGRAIQSFLHGIWRRPGLGLVLPKPRSEPYTGVSRHGKDRSMARRAVLGAESRRASMERKLG
jgi:hypothetical protein